MIEKLIPELDQAWNFLDWLNPGVQIHLECMESKGSARPTVGAVVSPSEKYVKNFVARNNGRDCARNNYFLPNAEFLNGKRNKKNVEAARFLHVDLDYKDYPGTLEEQQARPLAMLLDDKVRPSGIPVPTAVWSTGGGYQAVWRFEDSVTPAAAELLNKSILIALEGGPGTHNVDRLLRHPGTVNWLNDKKRAAGRSPTLSVVIWPENFDAPPSSYTPSDFDLPVPVEGSKSAGKTDSACSDEPIEPLPLPADKLNVLPDHPDWRAAIKGGKPPASRSYDSRSEQMFACVIWMRSSGVAEGHILSILLDPEFAIGDHIRDRHSDTVGARRYAERQIRRASATLEADGTNWPARTKEDLPCQNDPKNIRHALSMLGISIARNTFAQVDELEGFGLEDRDVNDVADILSSTFSRTLRFSASPAAIRRELTALAHEQRYNPLLDYLDELKWDGVPRVDTWLIDFCNVEDTALHREFGAKTLIAAVRRAREPGCKFDTMLVLEGPQGVGKSRFLKILAIRDEWFCESLNLKNDDRDRAQILASAWIIECQELDGLNKVTSENLKKFLSESTDTYRKPYDKNARQYPRHCIIVGTTNEADYLRDLTGNRRIWPVSVPNVDLASVAEVVDQLWAEAAHREAQGEEITLSPGLWPAATLAQTRRVADDPFADVLSSAFGDQPGKVSMDSIKRLLDIPTARLTPHDARRVKVAMEQQGWRYGTYQLYVQSAGTRRPVRGFWRGAEGESVPELGVKVDQDRRPRVVKIKCDGREIEISKHPDPGDGEDPF